MKTLGIFCVALALLLLPGAALAAERFEAGTHYLELPAPPVLLTPADGRLEVTLFFWYGCGACAIVDPAFTEWAAKQPKDLAIHSRPTTYAEPWNTHARIFMTLEEMGREAELHEKVFQTLQSPDGMVLSEDDFPKFAKTMGLYPKIFAKTYKSAAVDKRMESLAAILKVYDPQVVPSIVIDGRYMTDLGRVEDPAELLELTEMLVKKARVARSGIFEQKAQKKPSSIAGKP